MPVVLQPAPLTPGSSYATLSELGVYMGIAEVELDPSSSRLLVRASDLIDSVTRGRVDLTVAAQVVACRKAACAQVEHWLAEGEGDIQRGIKSYTSSKVSVTYSDTTPVSLCKRARGFLLPTGLLYMGASVSRGGFE